MGMDIHGLNPKQNKPLSDFPVLAKYKKMEEEDEVKGFKKKWKELDADHDLREQYWKEQTDYEEVNSGYYFRNNCWWWRPLWNYCHTVAPELNNDDLFDRGHSNSGAGLGDEGAKKLVNILMDEIASGRTIQYQASYEQYLDDLPDDVCTFCNGNNRGNIKMKDCKHCNGTGKSTNFNKHYPFDVDNVESFALFCIESGGFEIC
jgi:hypothetical protein